MKVIYQPNKRNKRVFVRNAESSGNPFDDDFFPDVTKTTKTEETKEKKEVTEEEKKEEKENVKTENKTDIDYKSEYERLSQIEQTYNDLQSYLEESYEGENLQEKITSLRSDLDSFKEKEKTLKSLQEKEEENEKKLRELSIVHSKEWQEEVEKPLQTAKDTFVSTLIEVDIDGNAKHPEQFKPLLQAIFNEGEDIAVPKIKAILKNFAEKYEEATGEEYDIPPISNVVKERQAFIKQAITRKEKFDNWEKENQKKEEQQMLSQEERTAKLLEARNKERQSQFNSLLKDFNYDNIEIFFKPDDVKEKITEVYDVYKKAATGEGEAPTFSDLIENQAKALMFDDLVNQAKIDRNFVIEHKEAEGDNLDNKPGERSRGDSSKKEIQRDGEFL